MATLNGPNLEDIRRFRDQIAKQTVRTPVLRCAALEDALGHNTKVFAKLEFLQRTGTFKARGALANLLSLDAEQLSSGVTAVSAGNHAIATAFAAQVVGTSAKVVMTASANPYRVAACKSFGAEVVIAKDVHHAFSLVNDIRDAEGRFFVHPFDGPAVALGTGTLGLEICEQIPEFDSLLVPVGGGGLISGVSNAVKQLRPDSDIVGIEPEGADTMHKSFDLGKPASIDTVNTIADSLGAPFAMEYSYRLTHQNVDRLALISDEQIRRAMGWLFNNMSIAVEPACAATTAGLLGPLRSSLLGKTVVLVMCGSNIDWNSFKSQAVFDDVA